ncbi:MAG: Re/Si-specific NAD(P)(+) transhydrogenase subunit alpha, partial [Bifidobacteriaceae bacterium]|nr:Re/Si-specific NAD(P)(+) transhydrogenase subunit alpha [Bifidobacteriaceae bacterium]
MLIGVPRESVGGERRVAVSPGSVAQLVRLGYSVVVESGAGVLACFPDGLYAEAGAGVVSREVVWGADVVVNVEAPSDAEVGLLRPGAVLVSLIGAPSSPELLKRLAAAGVTVVAMDSVPRISRAQALDVVSSMANIAGYRAVIEAAGVFGSFFTGQVTAAGKVPPARVFVSGAGVAGLAAIGAARALGAVVRATDIRAEVAEQVESMGAEFVGVEARAQESVDGYAREASADYAAAAGRMYAEQVRDVDIVVTTALIPGRPAPRLLTEEMVASMRPGSVVVDMAAASGGNVAGSRAGELVTTANGVKIIGYTDLAGRLPTQASNLFGQNVVNFFKLVTPGRDGVLVLDQGDVVVRGMTVVLEGVVTWPPPPVAVSAAPARTQAPPAAPPVPGGSKGERDPRVA